MDGIWQDATAKQEWSVDHEWRAAFPNYIAGDPSLKVRLSRRKGKQRGGRVGHILGAASITDTL